MRPIFAILMVIGIAVPAIAFSSYMALDSPFDENIPKKSTTDQISSLDEKTLKETNSTPVSPIPIEIATSNNDFTIDIYKQIVNDPFNKEENIFFSPFSIYTAFSFIYEGARENTAKQIEDVFGFNKDKITRHDQVTQTMESINRDDEHSTLETANALWLKINPQENYVDIARDVYQADVEELTTAKRINEWASEKTYEKITKVVTDDDVANSLLILNNAIYFKGTWATQFDPEETNKRDFFPTPNDSIKVDFMREKSFFSYAELGKVQVLQMPYVGERLSMFVFLPSEQTSIEQLEEMMSIEQIEKWKELMSVKEVTVLIPKFTAETSYGLNGYLANLGILDAFDDSVADFSGIYENLYIDLAKQDAFVKVNEEGTEAAAVTTIIMTEGISPELIFHANRPFIFTIEDDESGTILFMGKIVDPSL